MTYTKKILIVTISVAAVFMGLFAEKVLAYPNTAVPWYTSQITIGAIYPLPINGAYQIPQAPYYLATSTTGTSTFMGFLDVLGTNSTSTFTGFLSAGTTTLTNLTVIGSATSTFAQGINLTAGCFAVNNTCVSGGTASLSGGSTNTLTYWTSATGVGATSSPTVGYLTATSTTATSTFAGGLSITSGGFSIGTLSGPLQAVNGLVSASSTISVTYGGTGSTTLTGLLKGNGAGSIQTAVAGTDYQAPLSGGSPNTLTYWTSAGAVAATGSPTVGYIMATSTTATSTFLGSLQVGTSTLLAKLGINAAGTDNNLNIFSVSSTTASGTTSSIFTIAANGNVGVGTSTPGTLFGVNGAVTFTTATSTYYSTGGINLTAGCYALNGACVGGSSLTGSGSPNTLTYWTSAGAVAATGSPTVGYITATSTTATSTFNGNVDAMGTTTLTGAIIGPMIFPADAGVIPWINLPLTTGSGANSYSARIAGTDVLTIYANGNGIGGYSNYGVGIKQTVPGYSLDVTGIGRFTSIVDASNFVATTTATSTLPNINSTVGIKSANYFSSDGSVGFTGTCTILGLTSVTVKNGLIISCQ